MRAKDKIYFIQRKDNKVNDIVEKYPRTNDLLQEDFPLHELPPPPGVYEISAIHHTIDEN